MDQMDYGAVLPPSLMVFFDLQVFLNWDVRITDETQADLQSPRTLWAKNGI